MADDIDPNRIEEEMITHTQFLDLHGKIYGDRPKHMRLGQWAFKCLHDIDPVLATEISGSSLDPFYKNDRIPHFLTHIAMKSGQTNGDINEMTGPAT